jgi:hypothetical protein
MTTTIIDYTKMRMKNTCKREEVRAIGNMQCTAKEMEDKKSLSVTIKSKQIDPIQNILDLILSRDVGIDNGEIYDVITRETIRRIDEWMKI